MLGTLAVAAVFVWQEVEDGKRTLWAIGGAAALALVSVGGGELIQLGGKQRRRAKESAMRRRALADARPAISLTALLHPANEVVAFVGRTSELVELKRWCETASGNSIALIIGGGGFGKTRLSRQVGHHLAGRRWHVEPVYPGSEEGTVAAYLDPLDDNKRLLLVVDYAEARDLAGLARLVAAVAELQSRHNPPRLLLVARNSGDWWMQLEVYADRAVRARVDQARDSARVIELRPQLDGVPVATLTRDAAKQFAERLGLNPPAETLIASRAAALGPNAPLLKVHTAALLAVMAADADRSVNVIEELLHHESDYWLSRARRPSGDDSPLLPVGDPALEEQRRRLLRDIVGLAALFGAMNLGEKEELLRQVPELRNADAATMRRWVGWLTDLYGEGTLADSPLRTVQPDLIAEALAAQVIQSLDAQAVMELGQHVNGRQAATALEVLGRAAINQPAAAVSEKVEILRRELRRRLTRFGATIIAASSSPSPLIDENLDWN